MAKGPIISRFGIGALLSDELRSVPFTAQLKEAAELVQWVHKANE